LDIYGGFTAFFMLFSYEATASLAEPLNRGIDDT